MFVPVFAEDESLRGVRWVMLTSAVLRWHEDTNWYAVANDLGVSVHTLQRAGRDLTKRTLRQLGSDGGIALIEQFSAYLTDTFQLSADTSSHTMAE